MKSAPAAPPIAAVDDLIEATLGKMAAATPAAPSDSAADERAKKREERNAAIDETLLDEVKRGISALLDRKAEKLVVLDLKDLTSMADFFVLATATNARQAQAMADAVEMALKSAGRRPSSIEGYAAAAWILLDYGDVIFHVFHDEARRFYGLERLWGDATDRTERFVSAPKPRPVPTS